MTEHRQYFEGGIQSLAFEQEPGKKCTVGVMKPGKWKLGKAQAPEKMTVITGEIRFQGHLYRAGESFDIQVSDYISFEVEKTSSYLCEY